ncbi:hypothetical protein B0F90DRAFT_1664850 [Multifurca ochricompacta]|uniref:Uncharacterized protein n=1 Tax=Multifurca ochricompacta TaxID=376703 RepID=A0AAD4ME13_9AGAM|nr:hypothetical protein B0F90DRAFT_1664850 [Multifurca ochricompacta]
MSLPPTANDLDEKKKRKPLRQPRKQSQVFGELSQENVAPPHLGSCSEVPSADLPRQYISLSGRSFIDSSPRSVRFPFLPANMMPPSLLPPVRDEGLEWSGPSRLSSSLDPAHINPRDLTRSGLGRLRRVGSTRSTCSDENIPHPSRLPVAAETSSGSSSLRSLRRVHRPQAKDESRRWSVNNPLTALSHAHFRDPEDNSLQSQRRRVSLWSRRRITKVDRLHEQRLTDDQGQEDLVSGVASPPLTETQRVQSLRRGRKLAQVFGAEPPIALYRMASHVDGAPTTSEANQRERMKTYLLSSSDMISIHSGHPSLRHSHSSLSSVSISPRTLDTTVKETEAPQTKVERSQTSAPPFTNVDDDPNRTTRDSYSMPEGHAAFHRRRLRAAKLSRFFGVAYNDISGTTAMAIPERNTAESKSGVGSGTGTGWILMTMAREEEEEEEEERKGKEKQQHKTWILMTSLRFYGKCQGLKILLVVIIINHDDDDDDGDDNGLRFNSLRLLAISSLY